MKEKKNQTALITGITSGIGKALAQQFASNGYNIIGVARNKKKLEEVKTELEGEYQIQVRTIEKDLARDGAAQEIYEEVKKWKNTVNILVNDAGIGQRGNFVDIPAEKYSELIHLNVMTLTDLTRLYLREMVDRNEGKILQLGSIAGFQPGPLLAVYHATKAYVVSLSEALSTELEDMNSEVTVTCLCPGPTKTNFFSRGDMEDTNVVHYQDKLMEEPEKVAKGGYKALMNGERIYISGASNKITTFIRRVMPKSTQSKIQKKYYETYEE